MQLDANQQMPGVARCAMGRKAGIQLAYDLIWIEGSILSRVYTQFITVRCSLSIRPKRKVDDRFVRIL